MENLPVEILEKEIGIYLDISGLIAMSLVNKHFQCVYRPYFSKLILEIDPFHNQEETSVYEYLSITRVGTVKNVVFRIWKNIFDSIQKEIRQLYPYIHPNKLAKTICDNCPIDAVESIKTHIEKTIVFTDRFFIYNNVAYRNYNLSFGSLILSKNLESELVDLLDAIMHSNFDSPRFTADSEEEISDEEEFEYVPYENIIDSLETFVNNL